MSVLELLIPVDLPLMRLDKYLYRSLPGLPAWQIREAFLRKDVKMDGQRARPEDMIQPGANVLVYGIKNKTAPVIDVIYEDEQILLVNKPAGISVQADSRGGATIESLALEHVKSSDSFAWPPKACHRLDNQTCGLLLLAKSARAEELLTKAFYERAMKKSYICLVKGVPKPLEAVLSAYLVKDAKAARVQVFDQPASGALPITTGYTVIEKGEISRLQVDLITGRTHQIRAHLAHIGHPVLGDDAYGDRVFNKQMKAKRLMLCSVSLTLSAENELKYLDQKTFTILPPF